MKKLHLISVLSLSAALSAPVFAASAFEAKAGAASLKDAGGRVGFDAGLAYAMRIDRFFAIMPEVNFHWLSYTGSSGSIGSGGVTSTGASPSSNFYTLPVMLNGRLYIPMGGEDTPVFQPFVTAGAGYGWSSYIQTNPSSTETLKGFMYQAAIGGLLNMGMIADGSASSTSILFEFGYRGGILATSGTPTVNIDYGGFFAHAGVSLAL